MGTRLDSRCFLTSIIMLQVILLFLLFRTTVSEIINNVTFQKQIYERNLNSSIHLDKDDKKLRNTWMVDFQVKRINVTTKYRLQMTRHMEHSFRSDLNAKWTECVFLHRRQIRKSEKQYYADEGECLTTTTAEDNERTKAVEQMEKESRKWRRGYRYLVNTCNIDNPGDEEASTLCLIQYMEKDNYDRVIQRLIMLKLEAMGQLFLQLNNSLRDLEECLKTQLSNYLEKLRMIMDTLNKCYSVTTPSDNKEITEKTK